MRYKDRVEQIIGRGIRYCSHQALPIKKRNVTIYLHVLYMSIHILKILLYMLIYKFIYVYIHFNSLLNIVLLILYNLFLSKIPTLSLG